MSTNSAEEPECLPGTYDPYLSVGRIQCSDPAHTPNTFVTCRLQDLEVPDTQLGNVPRYF